MSWLIVVIIWFGLLAAWLAYVLFDDAKATLENIQERKARRRFEEAKTRGRIQVIRDVDDKDTP